MVVAEMVKFTRKVFGISQAQYAEDIGTNQTTVSFMERGFEPNPELEAAVIEYYKEARKKNDEAWNV